MKEVSFSLKADFIPLIQLLKFTGVAESGAHASALVTESLVHCNGQVELRKRYKVVKGDVITAENTRITVS